MKKIHLRDRSLYINAGVAFPKCYVKDVLDTEKGMLESSLFSENVTCKRCKRLSN